MTEHYTPRPWEWRDRMGDKTLYAGDTCILCADEGWTNTNSGVCVSWSNARLIAAAPDLLAACEAEEAAMDHYDECDACAQGCHPYYCLDMHMLIADAIELRQAAIAKAKGGGET